MPARPQRRCDAITVHRYGTRIVIALSNPA
jgi:hypothetical protein